MATTLASSPSPPPASARGALPASTMPAALPLVRWNTPKRLQAALGAIWLGAFLLFLATFFSVQQRHAAIKGIGQDAAPSILAAGRMKAYLADMDANLANELLAAPGANMESVKAFNDDRAKVLESLQTATQNITFGDTESKPIAVIQAGIADYLVAATQARDLHERGDAASLAAYRTGYNILQTRLLHAADTLDKVNDNALNAAYARQNAFALVGLLFVLLFGGGLLAVLFLTQGFLTRHTHRTINPGLLGATIVTLLFLLLTVSRFVRQAQNLKVAKQDAFDSVQALWQARATAYDANADESRFLLDRPNAAQYELDFQGKSARVATASEPLETVAMSNDAKNLPEDFKGYLADELRNITFGGEQGAASATLNNYAIYLKVDDKLRGLVKQDKIQAAVALCTGNNPGESNYAYNEFDKSLGDTLDINQKAFDDSIGKAFGDLSAFGLLNPLVLLAVVGLGFAGIRPRLREYAF